MMLILPKGLVSIAVSVACVLVFSVAQNTAHSSNNPKTITRNAVPAWLQDHMIFMTRGSGRWITDNSVFKSENELYDAYLTEWKWGIGKNSIRGRLAAIIDNKEVVTVWEYQLFWHPGENKAILHQFGRNGVFGVGEMVSVEDDGQTVRNTEMTFFAPDGTSWKDLHNLYEKDDEHKTISFTYKDETWREGRTYTWKREAANL